MVQALLYLNSFTLLALSNVGTVTKATKLLTMYQLLSGNRYGDCAHYNNVTERAGGGLHETVHESRD